MLAEGLAYIMNELFGGVVYAGIDTDKHRYPIGELILTLMIQAKGEEIKLKYDLT